MAVCSGEGLATGRRARLAQGLAALAHSYLSLYVICRTWWWAAPR